MSAKRGDRVAPTPRPGDWDVRFADNEAARGWEELGRQAPGNTFDAWTLMRRNPAPPVTSPRQHRLKHDLAARTLKGQVLDHWQIEVTGAGRVWYLVDLDKATVWVDYAGPRHPKATE
ncbi:MAG: hypothetical protein ACRDNO_32030 [Trebonia sp.]